MSHSLSIPSSFSACFAVLYLVSSISAANNGSFDGQPVANANTDTVEGVPNTLTTEVAAKTHAATQTETTATKPAETTEATAAHVTYNQWGFTGDQSIWEAPTTASTVTSGSKVSSAVVSIKNNNTSNANKLQGSFITDRDYTWKKVMLVSGVIGVSVFLNVL
ncbi:hypothetical protein CAAN1_01S08702 [[Candida] anglica]|uniref:Uncharacterized protein n=1 Tax=[Candida] anglica TaxID=148631 RepID=A0ABP0EP40_9ASCO